MPAKKKVSEIKEEAAKLVEKEKTTKQTAKKTPEPKPKEKKEKVSGKKTDREEVSSPVTEKPAPAAKKLRRESSTGSLNSLATPTGELVKLTKEETEKNTVPFDYADVLSKNNSKIFPPSTHFKIVTWNVAGLRALVKNGYVGSELQQIITEESPDVLCLQETKLSNPTDALTATTILDYTYVESLSTAKLGYAGTRTYLKNGLFDLEKSKHFMGFDIVNNPTKIDDEGRVVTSFLVPASAEARPITIINNYVPNSGMKLERLDYRVMDYDKMMRQFLSDQVPLVESQVYGSGNTGNIIWLGDLNVAEKNFDRFHNGDFKGMQKAPGFTPAERASFRETLKTANLVDSFRHFYPNQRNAYTFFSRMFNQRSKGNGWRLDYFAVSSTLMGRVVGTSILDKYKGSDHIPSVLYVKK